MGFTKYQKVEDAQVVSPEGHKAIEQELHKEGKTSLRDLPEEQRKTVTAHVEGDVVDK